MDVVEVQAALSRIEAQVDRADFVLFERLVSALLFIRNLVRAQRATIAQLRRLFGTSKNEKRSTVLCGEGNPAPGAPTQDPKPSQPEGFPTGTEPPAGPDPKPTSPPKPKPKRKGHGRVPASEYESATPIPVPHPSLTVGQACPGCTKGSLYELKEPARFLRITGQPLLVATCWDCQRLRCSACNDVYTARAPQPAQGPKFDESAVSMIALCRFRIGLPHHRLAHFQSHLRTPIPASTQWEALEQSVPVFLPLWQELQKQAAQGSLLHKDDSTARILDLQGNRRAKLVERDALPNPKRTGLFTTSILSFLGPLVIALFFTGRKYAGENLANLLRLRAPGRDPPTLMCDGLESRNLPTGHTGVESSCMTHARRGIVEQIENFPTECTHIIEQLGRVYQTDAACKKQGLSPAERLLKHQRDSAPLMDELHRWLTEQWDTRHVEPNSGLGKAYRYLLKRWHKRTLFLRQEGAPLDNNICERALKMAIRHRRNSLFYRSQRGADVGDLFMSLIYTAELCKENPFEFLTEVQRHAKAVAENPADWLPWTYRATLARLAEQTADSSAPPHSKPPRTAFTSVPMPAM